MGHGSCSPGTTSGHRHVSIGIRKGDRPFPEPKYDIPAEAAAAETIVASGLPPLVGKRAWAHTGCHGVVACTVRFVGDIEPCPHKYSNEFYEHPYETEYWIGVELDSPLGLNDGVARNGKRYFECSPMHGLFVRPERVDLMLNQLDCEQHSPNPPLAAARI